MIEPGVVEPGVVEHILALTTFAAVSSWTPGPNNLMLAASGANFGFQRSLPHIAGIVVGALSLFGLCIVGIGAVVTAAPGLSVALQLLGAAYLLWLAWRIAAAGRATGGERDRPLTLLEAAGFQFANPKAWSLGLGAATAFMDPALSPLVAGGLILLAFLLAMLLGQPVWVLFGVGIGRLLNSGRRLRVFNVAMGLLLALSVLTIVDLERLLNL